MSDTALSAPPTADPAVSDITAAFDAVIHAATRARAYEQLLATAGVDIDRAGAAILRQLSAGDGDLRLGHLADRLGVEAPAVTRKVQQLERNGLVARAADPLDGRAFRVRLTPAGHRVVERLTSAKCARLTEALAGWSTRDKSEFARLLRRFAAVVGGGQESAPRQEQP